jgi:hypothetical protein
VAATYGSTVESVRWVFDHVAHLHLGDGRILVVKLSDDGSVLRVFAPDEYARVDLARVSDPAVAAVWDVRAV